MYNKILVPLDRSKRAETILPYVEELARQFHATLILLSIIEPPPMMVEPHGGFSTYALYVDEIPRYTREAKGYLTGLAEQLSKGQIQSKVCVEQGPTVQTILAVAQREQVDLIALASHGRSGLARVFYGSVAAGILHQTQWPLLLIRAQNDVDNPDNQPAPQVKE
jgi:nucleotide-binding universal stress UspA family protein